MSNLAHETVVPIRPDLQVVERRVVDTDNGFTRIANELLEAIASADLTARQLKLMMAYIRKTYGFNKKTDRIADEQISQLTGLSRQNVNKAKKELLSMNCLLMEGSQIGINKEVSAWQFSKCLQVSNLVSKSETKDVSKLETSPVSNPETHKRHSSKDNKDNKDNTNTPVVPIEKKASRPETKSTQLSKNFSPSEKHQEMAKELGVNLEREFTKFVDYNLAKGNKYKVWDSALNNWLRRSAEFSGRQPGRGVAKPSPPMNHIPEGFTG